jgi:hypothetical protein
MAIFAALYFVLSLVTPYVPAVGVPEIRISLEALIATVFGLVLGPYLGAAAALLGAFVSFVYTGMLPTNIPFLLAPPLNALKMEMGVCRFLSVDNCLPIHSTSNAAY